MRTIAERGLEHLQDQQDGEEDCRHCEFLNRVSRE
jgi:uncharacterized protein (DUF169 family)